ncbi:major facilitator superfamily domain-containing protein 10 isoform X1 [Penaeus vannamei]|uniref:major facilitator superfamily domain-containing protein 10 isoform X1 n=2 Tax=Penaeus vannamei TaxID=6689 RepID=UPI00387F87CC
MVTLRSGTRTRGEETKEAKSEVLVNGKHTGTLNGKPPLLNGHTNAQPKKDTNGSKMQKVMFISLLLDLLGFTVILPLFPALLEYYSRNDSSGLYSTLLSWIVAFQEAIGIPSKFHSVLFGGLLGSLFSLLQFLSSPITGALSDVYGRRTVFICTLIGVAASYGMWAIASNFAIFVLARIIGGATKGNVSLAYSIMTDISEEKTRARGMAMIGVAFSIGFTIGPAIGAMFSRWGSTGWFMASAVYALVLAVLNVLYFYVFFKETLPESKRRKSLGTGLSEAWDLISPFSLFNFRSVKGLEKEERARLIRLGHVYFLYLFMYSGLEFTLTFVTHHKHHYSSMDQGRMFTFLGLVMAVMQGGYVRRIKDGSEKSMANMGLVMMIPAFILVGASETNLGLYAGLTLYALGSSMMVPCLTALASYHGADSHKGTLLGIWRSLGALARVIGPIVTSVFFWCVGAELCYIVGGLLMVVPLILFQSY